MPCCIMTVRVVGENTSKMISLVSVGLLSLSLIVGASCGTQGHPGTASRTSRAPLHAQKPSTNQESSSPLGHHCLPGSSIKLSTHQAAAPKFRILRNCYFADREGIRSQDITVETNSTSETGMYQISKVIRDSGSVWVDTTVVDFVKNTNSDHLQKTGRAYMTSQQFGGRIVVTLSGPGSRQH
jgi:hypothetical protein